MLSPGERRRTGPAPKPWRRGGGSTAAVPDALWLGTCMAEQLWHDWSPAPCGPPTFPRHPSHHSATEAIVLLPAARHRTLHVPPTATFHGFSLRQGGPLCVCVCAPLCSARLQPGTRNCRDQEREDELPSPPVPGIAALCPAGSATAERQRDRLMGRELPSSASSS